MATTTTITKLLFRRGNDSDRKQTILASGEPGITLDTKRLWIGDGSTPGGYPAMSASEKFFTYDNGSDPAVLRVNVGDSTTGLVGTLATENVSDLNNIGFFHGTHTDINNYHNINFTSAANSSITKVGQGNLQLDVQPGYHLLLGNNVDDDNNQSTFLNKAYIQLNQAGAGDDSEIVIHANTVRTEAITQVEGTIEHTLFTDATIDMNVSRDNNGGLLAPNSGGSRGSHDTGLYFSHNNFLSAGRISVGEDTTGDNSIVIKPPVYNSHWDATGITDAGAGTRTVNFITGDSSYTIEHNNNLWKAKGGTGSGTEMSWSPCKPLVLHSTRPGHWTGDAHLVLESGLIVYGDADNAYNAYKINQNLDTLATPTFENINITGSGDGSGLGVSSGGTGVQSLPAGGVIVAPHDSDSGPLISLGLEAGEFLVGSDTGWQAVPLASKNTDTLNFEIDATSGVTTIVNRYVPPGQDGFNPAFADHFKKWMNIAAVGSNNVITPSAHNSELKFKGDTWLTAGTNTLNGPTVTFYHLSASNTDFDDGPRAMVGNDWRIGDTAGAGADETKCISKLTFDNAGHVVGSVVTDLADLYPSRANLGTGGANPDVSFVEESRVDVVADIVAGKIIGDMELNEYGTVKSYSTFDLNNAYDTKTQVSAKVTALRDSLMGSGGAVNDSNKLGGLTKDAYLRLDAGAKDATQTFTTGSGAIALQNRPLTFNTGRIRSQNNKIKFDGVPVSIDNELEVNSLVVDGSAKFYGQDISLITESSEPYPGLEVNGPGTANDNQNAYWSWDKGIQAWHSYTGRVNGAPGTLAKIRADLSLCTGMPSTADFVSATGGQFTGGVSFVARPTFINGFNLRLADGTSFIGQKVTTHYNRDYVEYFNGGHAFITSGGIGDKTTAYDNDNHSFRNSGRKTYGEINSDGVKVKRHSVNPNHGGAITFSGGTAQLANPEVDRIRMDHFWDTDNTYGHGTGKGVLRIGSLGTSGGLGQCLTLDDAGNLRAFGDVVAFSTSDVRLKNNIEKITDPLSKIELLGGYEFDWNEKKQSLHTGHDYGVIAQEVEKVLPEVIETRDNGNKAVNYEKMIPLLIEGIKELSEKVTRLEKQLQE